MDYHKLLEYDEIIDIPDVALGIAKYGEQNHIGILITKDDDLSSVVHLAGHLSLRESCTPSEIRDFLFIRPKLARTEFAQKIKERHISVRCQMIYRDYYEEGLPYGIKYGLQFEENSDGISLIGDEVGFTCATFALAIFELCLVKLLDMNTWRSHPTDTQWQQSVLVCLRQAYNNKHPKVTRNYIEHFESEIGSVRLRPEQLISSGFSAVLPLKYSDAFSWGRNVNTFIGVFRQG